MKKIDSYEELDKLIMKQLKRGVYTNCFISKEEFETEIKNDTLFYHLYDGGLLLFRKMEDYFKMNFYINDFSVDFNLKFSETVVTEVVSKNGYDIETIIELLTRNGMIKKLKRVRLFCDDFKENSNNLIIEKENLKDYEKIVKILRENFDKYIGCIPTNEGIKKDIINQNFYCYKENNEVLGILHIHNDDKTSSIKHLAVDEKYRGKGVAKAMLNKYLSETNGLKRYVWTGSDNDIAQKVYSSMGYKLDGYTSTVLMKI